MTRTNDARPGGGARLFITCLGIGQIASWGSTFYSFPQIAAGMAAELGFSRVSLYAAATLGVALSGLAAYPVGVAIDRGYGRQLMLWCSVLVGLLMLAWSRVETLVAFYLIVAAVGLLQAAVLYEAAFAVIARRFGPTSARDGIMAVTLWGGFASTVFIPLVELAMAYHGWRGALVMLGLVNGILCAGLYGWVIRPARDAPMPTLAPTPPGAPRLRGPMATALRNPLFWCLLVSFTAHSATFSVLTYHLYPLLLEQGLDAAATVTVLAVIGPAQVAGRIVIRVLAPQASARAMGSVVVAGFPLSVAALITLPSELFVVLAIAVTYGISNGVMTIIRGIAVPEMISRRGYGAINGALTASAMAARAIAPVAAAAVWSLAGSYDAVLLAVLASSLILAGAFWAAAVQVMSPGVRLP